MDKKQKVAAMLRLYGITDRTWLEGRDLIDVTAEALDAGVTCIQLREKDASAEEEERLAIAIQELCRKADVPFIVNDNVELAARIGADGVHVGQEDCSCIEARRLMGEDAIVGVSAGSVEEALKAQADGADYLGVGAMYHTATKPEAADLTVEQLAEICETVDIPVVAIGGLNKQTISSLAGGGIAGVSVVSAIFAAKDVPAAVAELLAEVDKIL